MKWVEHTHAGRTEVTPRVLLICDVCFICSSLKTDTRGNAKLGVVPRMGTKRCSTWPRHGWLLKLLFPPQISTSAPSVTTCVAMAAASTSSVPTSAPVIRASRPRWTGKAVSVSAALWQTAVPRPWYRSRTPLASHYL